MTMLGMDTDQVSALARALDRQRARVTSVESTVEHTVTGARGVWRGEDVNRFVADWNVHRRTLSAVADALDELARKARLNVAAQTATSNDYSDSGGVTGSGGTGSGGTGSGSGIPVPDWPVNPLPPNDNPNAPLPPGPFPLPPVAVHPTVPPFGELFPGGNPNWPHGEVIETGGPQVDHFPGLTPSQEAQLPTGYDPSTEWGLDRTPNGITRH